MFHDLMLMIPGGAMPAAIVADYYDISIHETLIKNALTLKYVIIHFNPKMPGLELS